MTVGLRYSQLKDGATSRYCTTWNVEWSEAVESPPTHTSKVEGSSTQPFFAVLQYVNSFFPKQK